MFPLALSQWNSAWPNKFKFSGFSNEPLRFRQPHGIGNNQQTTKQHQQIIMAWHSGFQATCDKQQPNQIMRKSWTGKVLETIAYNQYHHSNSKQTTATFMFQNCSRILASRVHVINIEVMASFETAAWDL